VLTTVTKVQVLRLLDLTIAVWFQAAEQGIANLGDPALQGQCRLSMTFAVARRCVRELPDRRPTIAEVVTALTRISAPEPRRRRFERGGPSTPAGTSSHGNQVQGQDQGEGS